MSKENVVLFATAINSKPEIEERLSHTNWVGHWIEIGFEAGFEFDADEFCAVLEEVFRGRVTKDTVIDNFVTIRKKLGASEMVRAMRKFYIGGIARTFDFFRGGSV